MSYKMKQAVMPLEEKVRNCAKMEDFFVLFFILWNQGRLWLWGLCFWPPLSQASQNEQLKRTIRC